MATHGLDGYKGHTWFCKVRLHTKKTMVQRARQCFSSRVRDKSFGLSVPMSQEILSLGNIAAATIFPKEIVSL